MLLYRIYKAASAETRLNQLMTITLCTDWNAAVFQELCSLIIPGCQKLSVTTNNVKSPKIFKVLFLKKKERDSQCCIFEDLDDTLDKNSIHTIIQVTYENKHFITIV